MSRAQMTANERAEVKTLYERNGVLLERMSSLIDAGGGETDAWRGARAEWRKNVLRIAQILDLKSE